MAFNSRWVWPARSLPVGRDLAQQAIDFLVGAALPGAVGICKEYSDCESLGQAFVLGHLFPTIIGQRFAQRSRHMSEFLREALAGTPRIRPVHPGQDDQA